MVCTHKHTADSNARVSVMLCYCIYNNIMNREQMRKPKRESNRTKIRMYNMLYVQSHDYILLYVHITRIYDWNVHIDSMLCACVLLLFGAYMHNQKECRSDIYIRV